LNALFDQNNKNNLDALLKRTQTLNSITILKRF